MPPSEEVELLLERANHLVDATPTEHSLDARRLVEACRQFLLSGEPGSAPTEERIALRKLVEVLARGPARLMPLAALGRAALARHAGSEKDVPILLTECQSKLALFGH